MIKKNMPCVIFIALCILLSPMISAQSDTAVTGDENIFASGAFDSALATGKAAGDASSLSWLGGLTLVAGNQTLFMQESAHYGDTGTLSGKAFLKATQPDISSLFVSYGFSQIFVRTTNDPLLANAWGASGASLDTPTFQLSEFHLSFDVRKAVFVRVGNQLLSWGSSYFWSPADFVNERRPDSREAVDTRTGKPGVRLHIPVGSSNIFLFSDFSRTLGPGGVPADITKTAAFAFRADAVVLGFNTGLLGAFGSDEATRFGLAASGRILGVDVWAEAGSVVPSGGYDFSFASSAGGEKTFGMNSEWKVLGEFFYNSDGKVDSTTDSGKYYAYLSTARLKLLGGSSSLGLSGLVNISDLSWTAQTTFGLDVPKLLPVNFSLKYIGGEDGEFTLPTGGPAWTFGIQSILQF